MFGVARWRGEPLLAAAGLAVAACGSRSGLDAFEREVAPLAFEPPEELPDAERAGCVDITRSYSSVPATVLLLIDQSQSMSFAFGGSTRWEVLREAIIDPDVGLLASLDPNARVGLMLYTGRGGFSNPLGCPLITQVSAEFDNVESVRETYRAAGPQRGGDTPTGESITQAALALSNVTAASPKYILLATDGEPDTCAQPKPSEGLPLALEAASAAFAQGIRVFVLGVSDGLDAWRVQQLANAGAGKDPNLVYGVDADAEEPFSASTDPRELAGQLRGIIGDVRSCTVELGARVGNERVPEGQLVLDGQPLANDRLNGWTFVDANTVRLNGSACDKVLADGQRLEIRFPCEASAPPLR
jgi:von Willebrand factor type A domain-containing protein